MARQWLLAMRCWPMTCTWLFMIIYIYIRTNLRHLSNIMLAASSYAGLPVPKTSSKRLPSSGGVGSGVKGKLWSGTFPGRPYPTWAKKKLNRPKLLTVSDSLLLYYTYTVLYCIKQHLCLIFWLATQPNAEWHKHQALLMYNKYWNILQETIW